MHGSVATRTSVLQCSMRAPRYLHNQIRGPDERRLEYEIRHKARQARSADAGRSNLRRGRNHQQQAEIAAALMGLPYEEVLAEVKKTGRAMARSATRIIAGEQGAQRAVVVERRVVRRFGNDKRTGT